MREKFAQELYRHMSENKEIYLLLGDLGFGKFDNIRRDFKERAINCGASEQAMMGIAVGLAKEGKIPFVYSITNFLLYRPFETIRNYINNEEIPVKLIASGRDKDYSHEGYSHWSEDADKVIDLFPNIEQRWPYNEVDIPSIVEEMIINKKPYFLSLKK